jgi:PD-(D/E)XK endonuclease
VPGGLPVFAAQTVVLNTTAKGDIAEQAVTLALMVAGKTVLKPVSNGLRYDLAIDNLDGTFTRVQCKTGIVKRDGGVVHFRACSADARRPNGVAYHGQVDAFGVYCPEDGSVYLVPIDQLSGISTVVSLRLLPTKSGQEQGIRLAAAYRVSPKDPS